MADDLVVSGIHLDARQTLREIRRLDRRLGQLEGQIDGAARSSKKAQKGFRSMATAVAGAAAAFGAFRAAERASRFIFRVNREFQQLEARLVSVTGSVEEAESSFQLITDFAQETPFQIQGLVEGFTNLRLRGIQPTAEMMRDLGNFAAAFGSDFTNLINAITRAAQGGTERLREGFGIPIRKIGDELEITFQGTTRRVEATNEALIQLFRDLAQEHFPRAMARQMDTLVGSISNLEDTASVAANKVGEQGLNAAIQDLAGTIDEAIANNEEFARSLGENLAAGVEVSTRALELFIEHSEAIVRGMQVLTGLTAGRVFASLAVSMGRAAASGRGLAAVLTLLGGPAGVGFGAAGALAALALEAHGAEADTEELTRRIDELTASLDDLTDAEIRSKMVEIRSELADTVARMAELRPDALSPDDTLGEKASGMLDRIQRMTAVLGATPGPVGFLSNLAPGGTQAIGQMTELDRKAEVLQQALRDLSDALTDTGEAAGDGDDSMASGTERAAEAVQEMIADLEAEVDALQFTDKQLDRHRLELQGAIDAEIAYAMILHDTKDALEEKAEAEEEARKAEEKRIEDALQHMEDQREANRQIREGARERGLDFQSNLELARMQEEIRQAERIAEQISDAMVTPLNEFIAGTQDAEDAFADMITGILEQIQRLAVQETIGTFLTDLVTGIIGPGSSIPEINPAPPDLNPTAGGVPGFQHGGSFEVPGSGGPDSKLVRFMATPGEQVTVSPKGRGGGATPVQEVHNHRNEMNLHVSDVASFRTLLRRHRGDILRIVGEGARRGDI